MDVPREWELWVCRRCGDFTLGGWEELLHLPNHRCPGRYDPGLVERVAVVPKSELLSVARRALLNLSD